MQINLVKIIFIIQITHLFLDDGFKKINLKCYIFPTIDIIEGGQHFIYRLSISQFTAINVVINLR